MATNPREMHDEKGDGEPRRPPATERFAGRYCIGLLAGIGAFLFALIVVSRLWQGSGP